MILWDFWVKRGANYFYKSSGATYRKIVATFYNLFVEVERYSVNTYRSASTYLKLPDMAGESES